MDDQVAASVTGHLGGAVIHWRHGTHCESRAVFTAG